MYIICDVFLSHDTMKTIEYHKCKCDDGIYHQSDEDEKKRNKYYDIEDDVYVYDRYCNRNNKYYNQLCDILLANDAINCVDDKNNPKYINESDYSDHDF